MKIEKRNYEYKVDIQVPENFKYKGTILVLGDSFAELGMLKTIDPNNNCLHVSWMSQLAHSVAHNVRSFGLSGGNEQLCLKMFEKTLHIERVFTIIFHTEYHREDNLSGEWLPKLEISDYKKWDSLISEKTLHIYWHKNHMMYNFKNGKTLFCNYWDDKNTNFDFQKQRIPEILGANHMTYYGNLLLTNDIVKIIGDELRFND